MRCRQVTTLGALVGVDLYEDNIEILVKAKEL